MTNEPPSDSRDDIVDAYYDTGAYLTDPTRPGARIEPPIDCSELWSPAARRAMEIVRVVLVGPDAPSHDDNGLALAGVFVAEDIIRALEAEGFLVDPWQCRRCGGTCLVNRADDVEYEPCPECS
jgi:hypothetical protein